MNIAYLMTRVNSDSLIEVATAIREAQTEPPASSIIVMVSSCSVAKANKLLEEAGDYWTSKLVVPIALPSTSSQESKKGLLFKMFLSSGYTLFPGPYMVIDTPHKPSMENPLNVMEKLCDNRLLVAAATKNGQDGAAVPYGPVAIDRKVHHLRLFFAGAMGGWRDRMGLYLTGLRYTPALPHEFPFSPDISKKIDVDKSIQLDNDLKTMSDEDLRDTLYGIEGRRPHPASSRETLERKLYNHKIQTAHSDGN